MYILFGPSILHFEVILVGLIVNWNLLKRVLKESENLFVEFGYLVSRTVTLKDLGISLGSFMINIFRWHLIIDLTG